MSARHHSGVNYWSFSLVAGLCLLAGCAARTPEQQTEHDDVHYSSALSPYLRDLKPGASRKEVEDYLRARNIEFAHGCCAASSRNSHPPVDADVDSITLREEKRPWPCGTADVYIAFEFKRLPQHNGPRFAPDDTDILEGIHILKSYDCF